MAEISGQQQKFSLTTHLDDTYNSYTSKQCWQLDQHPALLALILGQQIVSIIPHLSQISCVWPWSSEDREPYSQHVINKIWKHPAATARAARHRMQLAGDCSHYSISNIT